jgi:hypothetical protein
MTENESTLILQMCKNACAITWDTCHKIYLAMDENQVEEFIENGYDPILRREELTPKQMAETLRQWYDDSCGLRFISAVFTNEEDPNAGYISLVPQSFL